VTSSTRKGERGGWRGEERLAIRVAEHLDERRVCLEHPPVGRRPEEAHRHPVEEAPVAGLGLLGGVALADPVGGQPHRPGQAPEMVRLLDDVVIQAAFMASTAISSLPVPVSMIAGQRGWRARTARRTERPSVQRRW
jgi:hypothetical protein